MPKFRVVIDKDLKDIVPEYIENRKKDCEILENLIKESNFDEIQKIGHKMAGSGAGYGFDDISRIGKEIEINAMQKNMENIQKALEELKNYVYNLEIVYE